MSEGRSARARRSIPQKGLIAFNAFLVVACLGAAGSFLFGKRVVSDIPRVEISKSIRQNETSKLDKPFNYLIIGTDSSSRLDSNNPVTNERDEDAEGLRSDVMMIVRVDPVAQTAAMLSIPRDTFLPIAPSGRKSRINTAIGGPGGAADLIDTIKENFGISIDHYVQIDFQAFLVIVDQIGGVPIYFDRELRDEESGLNIDEPGCRILNPDEALAYARARHLQYKNEKGRWVYDGTADLGRIGRQQKFVKLVLREAMAKGLRNPAKAFGVANNLSKVVALDEQVTVRQLVDLGSSFQSFSAEELETTRIPVVPRTGAGGAQYLDVLWDEADPVLQAFQGRVPGAAPEPRDVIVDVLAPDEDATGAAKARRDRAVILRNELISAGFDARLVVGEREPNQPQLQYSPGGADGALLLARYLDVEPEASEKEGLMGRRVLLTPGADALSLRPNPVDTSALDSDLVDALNEAATEAAPTTTVPEVSEPEKETTTTVERTTTTQATTTSDEAEVTSTTVVNLGEPSATLLEPSGEVAQDDVGDPSVQGLDPVDYEKSVACG